MADFFISCNKADKQWAEWIGYELEETGHSIVIQAWDFRPGSNFVLEMHKAAAEAERTIAVLSPAYLASRFTAPEWAAAFGQDPTGNLGTLLPVRVRECDPEGLLPNIVYIDLVGKDEASAKGALLAGIDRGRAKPAGPVPFPREFDLKLGRVMRQITGPPRFPGSLPPVWNVPHERNLNFTGRGELLDELHSALASGEPAALTQAVHGLGGVGKTQLAVEYAYRHAGDYETVWWVRAEEPATREADLAGLAAALGLPEQDEQDQKIITAAVRQWLARHPGWLLVLDNVPHPDDLKGLLPTAAPGHVIITSRDPNWRGRATPLQVQTFDRPVSIEFLLKRTGLASSKDEDHAAGDLAEQLGGLPLALGQAAAYIDETGITFGGYLDLLAQRREDLWDAHHPPEGYERTVAETFSLAIDQLRDPGATAGLPSSAESSSLANEDTAGQASSATPSAAEALLNLCAFLAPDDIPLWLLTEGADHLPAPLSDTARDPLALNNTIAALRKYSLVERSGDLLSIHRLLQAVCRDRLRKEDAQQPWAEAALQIVNVGYPEDEVLHPAGWPKARQLLLHGLAVTVHAQQLSLEPGATAYLLNQMGLYQKVRANFAAAEPLYRRALAIVEQSYGAEHPYVAACLNNLSELLRGTNRLAEAEPLIRRALAIFEHSYGAEHPEVAVCLNNLAGLLYELGKNDEAIPMYERVVEIFEKSYGENHPNVAIALNNLARLLQATNRLAEAEPMMRRALAIDEQSYGAEHPTVAIRLNNLATLLKATNRLAEAEPLLRRALAILRVSYGDEHPDTLTVAANLAVLEEKLKK